MGILNNTNKFNYLRKIGLFTVFSRVVSIDERWNERIYKLTVMSFIRFTQGVEKEARNGFA
jgi:hypothetical protein